ncbi:epoxide hydrolase [Metarhizium album ARSEF 1941]|uniref:Epoxide hydrolase n=1 Tax=Metarhizium album (strain ARSEF 1941) TaxID=1081103 RepID=A0A0B2WTW0_METAS|nr:epoxide hydrolase [Metarhizium album ARSEF 1941]KHN96355.1 epoxide hydrolase [Metarhizium album ARSEF 1941]
MDEMAAAPKLPKVLLFDIGGVCVVSPFQAILDYETSLNIPPGWVNYSLSRSAPDGSWHKLERGEIPLDAAFFAGLNADLHRPERWEAFYAREAGRRPSLPRETPPVPRLDGERLFNEMMARSDAPDPWMLPALRRLRQSGRYILGALSNTVIFPPGHALHRGGGGLADPVGGLFDVFVSSAHVGLRKPDARIYRLALRRLDEFARANAHSERGRRLGWGDGVRAADVLFLDDIGENLKAAKEEGFGTIKVRLGRAYEAVEELERVTGLPLAGDHPRAAVEPQMGTGTGRGSRSAKM